MEKNNETRTFIKSSSQSLASAPLSQGEMQSLSRRNINIPPKTIPSFASSKLNDTNQENDGRLNQPPKLISNYKNFNDNLQPPLPPPTLPRPSNQILDRESTIFTEVYLDEPASNSVKNQPQRKIPSPIPSPRPTRSPLISQNSSPQSFRPEEMSTVLFNNNSLNPQELNIPPLPPSRPTRPTPVVSRPPPRPPVIESIATINIGSIQNGPSDEEIETQLRNMINHAMAELGKDMEAVARRFKKLDKIIRDMSEIKLWNIDFLERKRVNIENIISNLLKQLDK